MDIFGYADECQRLRDAGIEKVVCNNEDWVKRVRAIALHLAATNGEVCSDDVLRILPRPDSVSPNAVGSVFKDKRLHVIGFKQSEKLTSHSRRIFIYALND